MVYFRGEDVVRVGETSATPFHKARGPDRTVCFCFSHTEHDVAHEVTRDGRSGIREAIATACHQGRRDCERANPTGRCCLADVGGIIEAVIGPDAHSR